MAYPIPVDELSLAKLESYKAMAKNAGLRKAINLRIAASMNDLDFREVLPATDLGNPAGTGYTNETYLTGAAVVNTWTSVFDTAAVPSVSNRAILIYYKIYDLDAAPAATAVRFRLGPTGATTLGTFFFESLLNTKLTPEVYLSEPIVYGPNERPFVEFYPRVAVAAAGERLGFGCFIAEPVGEVTS